MGEVPFFRRTPPPEPDPEPKAEPAIEPARPRSIPHRACGGIANKHCAHPGCTWRVCKCGKWGRMVWDGDLATWRTRWRAMT